MFPNKHVFIEIHKAQNVQNLKIQIKIRKILRSDQINN